MLAEPSSLQMWGQRAPRARSVLSVTQAAGHCRWFLERWLFRLGCP